jgi:hypothetical protein
MKTHIHPGGDITEGLKPLSELSESELEKARLSDYLPPPFCGKKTAESIDETLVRKGDGRDYCRTCLRIYESRR